jgi:CBS domain-containing protein
MSKYLVRLPRGILAVDALDLLDREAVHHALVTRDDDMEGVVCRCDLETVSGRAHVAECMKKDYVFVDELTTAREAAEMMQRWGIGFLPVIGENGELRGVLTRRDLRRTGFLPNRLGVDRCAACGETHSLEPHEDDWVPVFCKKCCEQPGWPYLTLGGGD